MATPHVTGAIALAYAFNPNATVSQILSALYNGVDKLSSLSGKVSTGGRLNVAKMLSLLGDSSETVAPTLTTLAGSASSVVKGNSVRIDRFRRSRCGRQREGRLLLSRYEQ